jgi:hypothetical protein
MWTIWGFLTDDFYGSKVQLSGARPAFNGTGSTFVAARNSQERLIDPKWTQIVASTNYPLLVRWISSKWLLILP